MRNHFISTISRLRLIALFVLFAIALSGCTEQQTPRQSTELLKPPKRIVAASYALQYLTQRIAGDEYTVEFPAAESSNPRSWKPSASDIADLQQAGLIVINGQGAEYAQWLVQVTLPENRICESCEPLALREQIAVREHRIIHSHGPEGEHSHAYMVPYPWLDPAMAMKQAGQIAKCLSRRWPNDAEQFSKNLGALEKDLQQLVESTDSNDVAGTAIVSVNPHFRFLTRSLELEDNYLLWFDWPAESESDAKLQELIDATQEAETATVLVGHDLPARWRKLLAENNLKPIEIDRLDFAPEAGNYLTAMAENLNALRVVGRNQ